MCVCVLCQLRNEYFCRWCLRKRGFVNFRILNFICHISEDSSWCPIKSQSVDKGRIIKLVKPIVIQGTLKSYVSFYMTLQVFTTYKCHYL